MEIRFSKKELAEYFPDIEQKAINSVWLALNIINDLSKDHFDVWARKHLPSYMYNYQTPRIEGVMWFCDRSCLNAAALNR